VLSYVKKGLALKSEIVRLTRALNAERQRLFVLWPRSSKLDEITEELSKVRGQYARLAIEFKKAGLDKLEFTFVSDFIDGEGRKIFKTNSLARLVDAHYWLHGREWSVEPAAFQPGDLIPVGAILKAAGKGAAAGCFAGAGRTVGRELAGGAARRATYGHLWQKASLQKAISRHAGKDHTTWVTKTGKRIYENPATGRQVVHDIKGGYFRIFQPNKIGGTSGKYLDLLGKVPAPATRVKGGAIKTVPLTGDALKQSTHFLIK